MRLQQLEKGDGIFRALLIRFISKVSGMRLPDAARIVMFHPDFYGTPMTAWTQATMRGESTWSVGERELFAAITAKWNACPFCIAAHSAIASLALDKKTVTAALEDYHGANLPSKTTAMLAFLEKLIQTPGELTSSQVAATLQQGISPAEMEDALAVVTLFSITVRCANAFNFALLNDNDLSQSAKRLLTQGYVFGKSKMEGRPDHRQLAEALRKRIFEGPGLTAPQLRQAVSARANGGAPLPDEVYDAIALQIGHSSYKITDEMVKQVVLKTGSEKAAFELMIAAAVGVGMYLWQTGIGLLDEAQKK